MDYPCAVRGVTMCYMTINSFTIIEEPDRLPYVPWDNIKEVMPPEMYERWVEVSMGSTSYPEGFYKDNLAKFLRLYNKGL
jgi:hypothetical protein